MPKINLIKRKKKQILQKKVADDDTIKYDYGPNPPSNPDVGSIWLNTSGGLFHVWDGDDWIEQTPEHIDFDNLDLFDPVEAYDRAMGVV